MGAERQVTSGGGLMTSGGGGARALMRRPATLAALGFAGFGILYMIVNAVSMIDQRRELGQPSAAWQAWVLEGSSYIAWLMLLAPVLALAARLAGRPLWQAVPGHAAGWIAASIAHSTVMSGFRIAAYALAGAAYVPAGSWTDQFMFEARKDLITYVSVVAVFLLARRLLTSPASSPPAPTGNTLIELREGSRVVLLRPDEIDWVGAAGNYVEFQGAFGSELARRTMADVEAMLAPHDFVRIHRSRLVRRGAIAAIETRQSGDFDVTLRSGTVLAGSRRFRQNLKSAATEQSPA